MDSDKKQIPRKLHFQHFSMFFRVVLIFQKAGERPESINSSHLFGQLRNKNDVEVLEEVKYLVDVLVLHLATGNTLTTCAVSIGEDNLHVMREWLSDLVNNNGIHVDLVFGELLNETFRFVHTQEFGDTDSDESRFVDILETL